MRIDSAFPSTYLKAADLQGRNVTVTISHVRMEDVGDDHKPVLYFVGKEKGLALNKTNSNNISALYGYETDDWTGKPIELFEAQVDYQGKSVPAIRVRIPRNGNGHAKPATAAPVLAPPVPPTSAMSTPARYQTNDDLNDEVPF